VYEQKEKWERNSEENHGLAAPNPFVDPGKFITDRSEKRKNGKFCSDVPGRPAGPVNLRITEAKTVFEKVAGNSRDIALSPTPMIDVGLID
jgi:hypothetical protein